MCRFGRNDDQGFLTVIEALKRYAHEAPTVVVERRLRARKVLEEERNWQAEELRRPPRPSEDAVAPSNEQETEVSQRPTSLVTKPAWQV